MKLLRVWINYINPNITKQANLKILNIPRETGNRPGKKKNQKKMELEEPKEDIVNKKTQ